MKQPLEGVTVIDMTEVWAGPMGTSLLGDLGARVIKVESYPRSSMTRLMGTPATRGYTDNDPDGPRPWDRQAIHNMANRNKYGITLDLSQPEGLQTFKELVKITDVLVEGYSSGTMARLGIDYAAMKVVRPDIIMVSMPGWGVEGPYKGYVTLGAGLDAFSGHHALRGYPDTDPSSTQLVHHTDAVGAVNLAFGVLTALLQRGRSGEGRWIDMSQMEAFLPHLSRPLMDYLMNGRSPQPMGNQDYSMAPHGCYRCAGDDNWVVITVASDQEWKGLCDAMDNPEWTQQQEFADPFSRHKNQDLLDQHIEGWTQQKDKYEVMHFLQARGVPAETVLDDEDLYTDPHLESRSYFETVSHPTLGVRRHPGYLWKLEKAYEPVRIPPNGLGEHNQYVLGTLLGMERAAIEDLKSKGIIGSVPP